MFLAFIASQTCHSGEGRREAVHLPFPWPWKPFSRPRLRPWILCLLDRIGERGRGCTPRDRVLSLLTSVFPHMLLRNQHTSNILTSFQPGAIWRFLWLAPISIRIITDRKKKKAMADRGVNKFAGNSITVLYFVLGGEWEGTEWHGLGCPKQNKTKNNPLAPKWLWLPDAFVPFHP